MEITDDQIYGRDALKKGEPWIVPESLDYLKSIVQPHWYVFEWGSGGSTIFFARHCRHIISIEHHKKWHTWTSEKLRAEGLARKATVLYVPGVKDVPHEARFEHYSNAILDYPDKHFNLVFVDGEASSRGYCVTNALAKVRPGGYLLLDNSNWLKRDIGWPRKDCIAKELKWIGQEGTFDWWTSIFHKPEE